MQWSAFMLIMVLMQLHDGTAVAVAPAVNDDDAGLTLLPQDYIEIFVRHHALLVR